MLLTAKPAAAPKLNKQQWKSPKVIKNNRMGFEMTAYTGVDNKWSMPVVIMDNRMGFEMTAYTGVEK